MPAPQLLGWLQGLGLVPAQQDDDSPVNVSSARKTVLPDTAPATNSDRSLRPASYDEPYATPQARGWGYPPQAPQYCAPPACASGQARRLCRRPPPRLRSRPRRIRSSRCPRQRRRRPAPPQQYMILQQAPQQAAPINLLTVAAAPSQPVQAAPTQAVRRK